MRGNRRFWVATTLAGLSASLGIVIGNLVLLSGGIVLGLWCLCHQAAFISQSRSIAGLEFSLRSDRDQMLTTDSETVHVETKTDPPLPVDVTVVPELPPSVDHSSSTTMFLPTGDRTAETTFEVSSSVAGRKTIGPVHATFRDRGGFFTGSTTDPTSLTIDVRPHVPRRLHVGTGGKRLSTLYGEHRVDRTGAGTEPYEVREYTPGDRLSRIDWKATARLNHPHIREYERTQTHETALVVDHRASTNAGPENETKLDHLREVALGFVATANEFGDPLAFYAVGDEGATVTRDPAAGVEQYESVSRLVRTLEPTETDADTTADTDSLSPTEARTRAKRLERDGTRFGATLHSYFEESDTYVRRLRDRPLFRTVRLAHSRLRGGSWTVVLTDDSSPTEVREAARFARRSEGRVMVFLAPSVLYEPGGLNDLDRAYERYREFEEFRKSLARMDRVSTFEVGPSDRLETVVGRHDPERRWRRNGDAPPTRSTPAEQTPDASRRSLARSDPDRQTDATNGGASR